MSSSVGAYENPKNASEALELLAARSGVRVMEAEMASWVNSGSKCRRSAGPAYNKEQTHNY